MFLCQCCMLTAQFLLHVAFSSYAIPAPAVQNLIHKFKLHDAAGNVVFDRAQYTELDKMREELADDMFN
jgi:hypothetical protein